MTSTGQLSPWPAYSKIPDILDEASDNERHAAEARSIGASHTFETLNTHHLLASLGNSRSSPLVVDLIPYGPYVLAPPAGPDDRQHRCSVGLQAVDK